MGAVVEGRTGLEQIPRVGCDRHLRAETIGRIGVIVDGHPEIFPINYAVDERGDIYFRADAGTKLAALASTPSVAFEIDGIDEEHHLGWSVLVVGAAARIGTPEQLAHVRTLPLEPWATGEKSTFVRITPTKVTG